MRKLVLGLLGATALTFGAGAANATTVLDPINQTLLDAANTDFFGATIIDEPGSFNHTFTFNLSGDMGADAALITEIFGGNDIDFTSILLDTYAFTQTVFDGSGDETWALDPSVVLSAGMHTIYVNGNVVGNSGDGSYSGVINLSSAVPEPATWGMMLLGFGAVGFAMRRRRQPVLTQVA